MTLGSSATSYRKLGKVRRPGCIVTHFVVAESPRQSLQPRLFGSVARPRIRTAGTQFDRQGGSPSFQTAPAAVVPRTARLLLPKSILDLWYVLPLLQSDLYN